MSERAPRHPEARTMVAFIEGRLAPDELASVGEHLRGCAECRTVVTETTRFTREEQRATAAPRRTWWWLGMAAAIATVAVIAAPAYRWIEARRSPIGRLIAASPREHRTVEGRLAGFPWARLQAPARGEVPADPAEMRLTGAAGDVIARTADQKNIDSLHANGVANLLTNHRAEALAALMHAANGSNDPRVWNDLAAARYAIAVKDNRPSELPQALAEADRAIRLDPKRPEGYFNRALIIERLGVLDEAQKAWERYLQIDGTSDWSSEARGHLRALTRGASSFDPRLLETAAAEQLVHRWPHQARLGGEGLLLARWAASESGDDPAAGARLGRIRAIASALVAFNNERLLTDAVAAIDRASGSQRRTLVEAHGLYAGARKAYSERNAARAEAMFRRAEDLFRQSGSSMGELAHYYIADTLFSQHRLEESRDALLRLQSSIDADRHRALAALIHRNLAVVANTTGDWSLGAREATASAAAFRALGETSYAGGLETIAAVAFEMMGERDLAWSQRIRSFTALDTGSDRSDRSADLHSAAITLAAAEHPAAAQAIIDLALDGARGDAVQLTGILSDRAVNALRDGDIELAGQALLASRAAVAGVRDVAAREILAAQIDLADAAIRRPTDPHGVIASLGRVIGLFQASRFAYLLPQAYLERARTFRAVSDLDAADADYSAALRELDKRPPSADSFNFALLDTAEQIIEETIDLRLSRGEVGAAFAVANGTRSLLESSPAADVRSANVPRPGRQAAIIEYAVLPRGLALFFVSDHGLFARRIDVDRQELALRIEIFDRKIRQRASPSEIQDDGTALYRLLIAPVRQQLSGVRDVVIIPDRELYTLPFAALWDETRRRYLAEDIAIRFASAAGEAAETGDRSLQPAVVVSDPAVPGWPVLPASRREAAGIARLHHALLLEGQAATHARFVDAAGRSALIHYAGHANSDAAKAYGALMLAGDESNDGVLGAGEIAHLTLSGHPLVVLAACGTFRGEAAHVQGMSSLARAFLVAGARGVVGTLWEIDDDVSAAFFSAFHQSLRTDVPEARSLQATQIEMIHSASPWLQHPAAWASIEILTRT